MIIIIDNYDSFTYNVYQALAKITTEEIRVLRSRECTIADIEKLNPSRLIVSPGPGRPEDAGISVEAIKHFAGKLPILGVCLGDQAIGYAVQPRLARLDEPVAERAPHHFVDFMHRLMELEAVQSAPNRFDRAVGPRQNPFFIG